MGAVRRDPGRALACPTPPPKPVARSPTASPGASIDGKRPIRSAAELREAVGITEAPDGAASAAGTLPGYSPTALLRKKPFEECTATDLVAMERVLARLAAKLATRRSRRLVPSHGQGVPDLRRSLRRAVATGGELLSLARRARAVEEPRLVFLCDTSGSMDAHARFLLAFVLSLKRAARATEVFAFNTELVRLTPGSRPGRSAPRSIASLDSSPTGPAGRGSATASHGSSPSTSARGWTRGRSSSS
jgi:uncharacterized protein with von Willebrand factor type A (vWA) domain